MSNVVLKFCLNQLTFLGATQENKFLFHYLATNTGTGDQKLCLGIRKLMSVVKDVDLEAMPTSIFLNDDDDDDVGTLFHSRHCVERQETKVGHEII